MVLTLFLLGLLYVVLVVVAITAGVGAVGVLAIAAAILGIQLFASDKIALGAMGAREVTPAEAPELHAVIERLCLQADLPKPRVAMVQSRMPNACALGRSRETATVCVTTGLIALLSPAELEGVLAHELTHVINHDVMVMTIASFFASIAALLVRFGFIFGRAASSRCSRSSCSCPWPSTRSRSSCSARCPATASTPRIAARRSSPAGRAPCPRR